MTPVGDENWDRCVFDMQHLVGAFVEATVFTRCRDETALLALGTALMAGAQAVLNQVRPGAAPHFFALAAEKPVPSILEPQICPA